MTKSSELSREATQQPFCEANLLNVEWLMDQACGQDGWILAQLPFFYFQDRDEIEFHNNNGKKEQD